MQWSSPPAMTIDQNKTYTATLKTNFGDIKIQLLPKFYKNLGCQRIIVGFLMIMIQISRILQAVM